MKVKSFSMDSLLELEEEINKFLDKIIKHEVIDVKYAVVHESIATDSESGVYSDQKYTALVIYRP